ncbi:hypothetical protein NEMBOFW57_009830 [Staphylotrichum longicolle]|uniref:Uncharacterized protein n=1 Tax=Staphylotrichum longicolle TaxID=669026 RepID=A0AAD4EPT3_9PEZI|nr:hypothetical protein NEMBOFW57_009830 [Staphylotrichum longicolle]
MAAHQAQQRTTLDLLDLPDELVDQILVEVKYGAPAPTFDLDGLQFYENLTTNTDALAIQRVRLTCRRLASRALPLLLPVASVSICDPASVDRVEQIAGHPALAPYVKAVRVCFGFYEAELAADARRLADRLLNSMKFQDWAAFRQGGHVMQWMYGSQETLDPKAEDSEGMRLLRKQHAEYRRRYEAQQHLAPSVVDRIAAAVARMPRATRLVLDDGPDPGTPPPPAPATQERWLIAPTTWATAFKLGRATPPIETLFALPAAIHGAGVTLTALRIHRLRLPSEFPSGFPSDPEDEEDLPTYRSPRPSSPSPDPPSRTSRRPPGRLLLLRTFEFTPLYDPNSWLSASPTHLQWPGMSTYRARAPASTSIDLQMIRAGIPHELAMPPPSSPDDTSPPPAWRAIRTLHLRDGALEARTLTAFLSATRATLRALRLDGMRLCSQPAGPWPGTQAPFSWARVLDQLREHCLDVATSADAAAAGQGGQKMVVRIRRPEGAEFDDQAVDAEDLAALGALFDEEVEGGGLSAVDEFVQGLRGANPIVELGKTKLLYP